MAGAWFVVGIFALAIITAVLKIYVTYIMPRHLRFAAPTRRPDYVTRAPLTTSDDRVFPHSRQEAEAEAGRKLAPGSDDGMLVITQAALQGQLDDAEEQGMIRAFAAMHKGGYLPAGKATEIKRALFGVAGGRRLQGLNRAIDAVMVGAPPPAPAPPRVTPLAQRPIAADLEFAGELPE
jgi:hypothetical protein